VADVIGARCNPPGHTVRDDVVIGVKMSPNLIRHDKLIPRAQMGDYYLDFIDHHTCLDWLSHWPETKVIVCSRSGEQWLKERIGSPLFFIPQHHCNVERERRPLDRPVRVVGYVGVKPADGVTWPDQIETAVRKMGLEMRWFTDYQDRADVVDAYRQIDIQLGWREGMVEKLLHLKNPMKVISAASYGIPTVAKREPAYELEVKDQYLGCDTIAEAADSIFQLAFDRLLYLDYANTLPTFAEPYHLTRIAEQFRRLGDA
jgi:hypothetical protein